MEKKAAVVLAVGTVVIGGLVALGNWYYREITFRN